MRILPLKRPTGPALPAPAAATVSVRGEPADGWAFFLHNLGGGHWAAVARAPPAAVVDAWGVSAAQHPAPSAAAALMLPAAAVARQACGQRRAAAVPAGPSDITADRLHPAPSPPATLQGFRATFQQTAFSAGEWEAQLRAPEPAFSLLTLPDLLSPEERQGYEAAGGELL